MKTFKMIRIYKTTAEDRRTAREIFRETERLGTLDEFLESEFVKVEEQPSLFGQVRKQVTGK